MAKLGGPEPQREPGQVGGEESDQDDGEEGFHEGRREGGGERPPRRGRAGPRVAVEGRRHRPRLARDVEQDGGDRPAEQRLQ